MCAMFVLMGSMITSLEALLTMTIMPMKNAYHMKDYESAMHDLYELSEFLIGFGEGIENFPKPPERMSPNGLPVKERDMIESVFTGKCKTYYHTLSPPIFRRWGKYQRTVLDIIKAQNSWTGGIDGE